MNYVACIESVLNIDICIAFSRFLFFNIFIAMIYVPLDVNMLLARNVIYLYNFFEIYHNVHMYHALDSTFKTPINRMRILGWV